MSLKMAERKIYVRTLDFLAKNNIGIPLTLCEIHYGRNFSRYRVNESSVY